MSSEKHPSYHQVSLAEEKKLVLEAKADLGRFQSLYEIYFDRIYRYCYLHTSDSAEAEDLCSQTFLKALEAFPTYEWQGVPFGAWLYTIAGNLTRNYYRDHKKHLSLDDVPELSSTGVQTNFEAMNQAERHLVVRQLLREVALNCKDILIFRFFEDLAYDSIAERMGKTTAACKMQVKRCLQRLKQDILLKAPDISERHPAFTE